jgi:hypothetical protein
LWGEGKGKAIEKKPLSREKKKKRKKETLSPSPSPSLSHQRDPPRRSLPRNSLDVVDDAVRERGRGSNHQRRVAREAPHDVARRQARGRGRRRRGARGRGGRGRGDPHAHAKVVRRLKERRVRRGGQHDLGPARLVPEPRALPGSEAVLPSGEHGEQDRLGAAAGDLPPHPRVVVLGLREKSAPGEDARGHGDDVSLEADGRGEDGGVLFF